MDSSTQPPTAFVSYSWESDEHRDWVKELSTRLRSDGVATILDQWAAVLGDQLPEYMERGIRDNDFVLIVCTPTYKAKSDSRTGGVGYEGDIMTAEVLTDGNHRKFIPILRQGSWSSSLPSWLKGKLSIDLSGNPYSEANYDELRRTLLGIREHAPPVTPAKTPAERLQDPPAPPVRTAPEEVTITRIISESVTTPKNDGTRGSALYMVPFQLSRRPSVEWQQEFLSLWRNPPRFTTMHRSSIASIVGDQIRLDGTTIEEIRSYHHATLKLCVEKANQNVAQRTTAKQQRERVAAERAAEHKARIETLAAGIHFGNDDD